MADPRTQRHSLRGHGQARLHVRRRMVATRGLPLAGADRCNRRPGSGRLLTGGFERRSREPIVRRRSARSSAIFSNWAAQVLGRRGPLCKSEASGTGTRPAPWIGQHPRECVAELIEVVRIRYPSCTRLANQTSCLGRRVNGCNYGQAACHVVHELRGKVELHKAGSLADYPDGCSVDLSP